MLKKQDNQKISKNTYNDCNENRLIEFSNNNNMIVQSIDTKN